MPKTVEEAKKKDKKGHRLDHLAATASLLPGDVFGTVNGPPQVTDPRFTPVHLPVAIVASSEGRISVNNIKIRQEAFVKWTKKHVSERGCRFSTRQSGTCSQADTCESHKYPGRNTETFKTDCFGIYIPRGAFAVPQRPTTGPLHSSFSIDVLWE